MDAILLIPDYENEEEVYPGDIKPGVYSKYELAQMLRELQENPEAIQFLADMLE